MKRNLALVALALAFSQLVTTPAEAGRHGDGNWSRSTSRRYERMERRSERQCARMARRVERHCRRGYKLAVKMCRQGIQCGTPYGQPDCAQPGLAQRQRVNPVNVFRWQNANRPMI